MAFFPHKSKGDPATVENFLQYSIECGKQHDLLAALFYCYWGLETIKKDREKIKKKEHVNVDEVTATFTTRAAEIRAKYNQHPIASMMKDPEIEVMWRRILDLKNQIQETAAMVPATDEEAGKLGLKLKVLAEEGSFLDELFSPLDHVEGSEVWQDRLAKGVENLFTNLSRVQAVAAAEAAEALRKAEFAAAEAREKAEVEAAEARMKEEEVQRRVEAKETEARMKEEEARQKTEAKVAEARKMEEEMQKKAKIKEAVTRNKAEIDKATSGKHRYDDQKIEDPPATVK